MSNEKDNEKITTIYDKIYDKPLSIDKIQSALGNHGDDIQNDLDKIAKLTENIMGDIEENTMKDVVKVDFTKKKKDKK